MEAALIRISPRLRPKAIDAPHVAFENRVVSIDSKTFQFYCNWAGDPFILQDLISSCVDWGPFSIRCEREKDTHKELCRCQVQYYGPAAEQSHLMASFWGLMEGFPPFQSCTHSFHESKKQR